MYASLYAIQGLLYSFDSFQPFHSVGHIYYNSTWIKMNTSVAYQPSDQSPVPKYAIPYLIRL